MSPKAWQLAGGATAFLLGLRLFKVVMAFVGKPAAAATTTTGGA